MGIPVPKYRRLGGKGNGLGGAPVYRDVMSRAGEREPYTESRAAGANDADAAGAQSWLLRPPAGASAASVISS